MNRSPGLAGVLSVPLPGLGHLYAGATARGLALAAAFVAVFQDELVPLALAIWIFGIVNAIRTTEEIVRARAEGRPASIALDRHWAIGLMGAGAVAILARISELEWVLRFWPLILVWIGLQVFRGRPLIPGSLAASAAGSEAAPDATAPPGAAPLADVPAPQPDSPDTAPSAPADSEEK